MDNKQEEKSILQEILTKLSSIGKKEDTVKEEIAEVELSQVETEAEAVEVEAEEKVELSKEVDYITKEDFESYKTELSEIMKGFVQDVEKEREEISEKVVELSAQPSADAIVHSPEVKEEKQKSFQYGKNRPRVTADFVMESLNKFN